MKNENLEKLFFPVKKVLGKDLLPGYGFAKRHSHYIVGETPDGPMILNACSPGYGLVTNEQRIRPIIDALGAEWDIETKVRTQDYSRFFVDFKFLDQGMQIAMDKMLPVITLQNSYNGTLKFGINAGLERVVCLNGLTVPVAGEEKLGINFRHTLAAEEEESVEETTEFVREFIAGLKEITSIYTPMTKRKLSKDVAFNLLDEIIEEKYLTKPLGEIAVQRLEEEINMGLPISQWLVYNAGNFALNHPKGESMTPNKMAKADLKLISYFQY